MRGFARKAWEWKRGGGDESKIKDQRSRIGYRTNVEKGGTIHRKSWESTGTTVPDTARRLPKTLSNTFTVNVSFVVQSTSCEVGQRYSTVQYNIRAGPLHPLQCDARDYQTPRHERGSKAPG